MESQLLERCSQSPYIYYCHQWYLCDGIRGIRYQNSNIIYTGCLHGYFHTIFKIKFYSLGWSIQLNWLIRPGIMIFGGSTRRQPPAKRFFHTTYEEVVYFKTFLLSVILRPRIYPLLMVTLPLKKRYIVQRQYQTNSVTTDSKSGETKVKVAVNSFEIIGNVRQHFQNHRLKTRGISPLTLLLEGIYSMWPSSWRNWSFHTWTKQAAKYTRFLAANWNAWQSLH